MINNEDNTSQPFGLNQDENKNFDSLNNTPNLFDQDFDTIVPYVSSEEDKLDDISSSAIDFGSSSEEDKLDDISSSAIDFSSSSEEKKLDDISSSDIGF